jgi:hypothetical protein
MRSWKSHRLISHTWLGLNPQIGRPFSRIVGAIGHWGPDLENTEAIRSLIYVSLRRFD